MEPSQRSCKPTFCFANIPLHKLVNLTIPRNGSRIRHFEEQGSFVSNTTGQNVQLGRLHTLFGSASLFTRRRRNLLGFPPISSNTQQVAQPPPRPPNNNIVELSESDLRIAKVRFLEMLGTAESYARTKIRVYQHSIRVHQNDKIDHLVRTARHHIEEEFSEKEFHKAMYELSRVGNVQLFLNVDHPEVPHVLLPKYLELMTRWHDFFAGVEENPQSEIVQSDPRMEEEERMSENQLISSDRSREAEAEERGEEEERRERRSHYVERDERKESNYRSRRDRSSLRRTESLKRKGRKEERRSTSRERRERRREREWRRSSGRRHWSRSRSRRRERKEDGRRSQSREIRDVLQEGQRENTPDSPKALSPSHHPSTPTWAAKERERGRSGTENAHEGYHWQEGRERRRERRTTSQSQQLGGAVSNEREDKDNNSRRRESGRSGREWREKSPHDYTLHRNRYSARKREGEEDVDLSNQKRRDLKEASLTRDSRCNRKREEGTHVNSKSSPLNPEESELSDQQMNLLETLKLKKNRARLRLRSHPNLELALSEYDRIDHLVWKARKYIEEDFEERKVIKLLGDLDQVGKDRDND